MGARAQPYIKCLNKVSEKQFASGLAGLGLHWTSCMEPFLKHLLNVLFRPSMLCQAHATNLLKPLAWWPK